MGRIFFRRVNVIDGIDPPKANTTVVVEGDRITAVGVDSAVPKPSAEDTIFDLEGRSLMPGMWSCHCHLTYDNVASVTDVDMKHPPAYTALWAARNATLLLNSGFTGMIGAGSPFGVDVALKQASAEGLIRAPRVIPSGRMLVTIAGGTDTFPSFWKSQMSEASSYVCTGATEFRAAARHLMKDGVEMIKIFATGGPGGTFSGDVLGMSKDEIDAVVQTAHERGMKVRAHALGREGTRLALKAGVDLVDHGLDMDDACIELMARQGTFFNPGVHESYTMVELGRKTGTTPFGPPEIYDPFVEFYRKTLPKALAAGVKLVVGDDWGLYGIPHDGSYAKELEDWVEGMGVLPLDVLRCATRNGAEVAGMKDDLGTIEPGKLADLLIINGNPVDDITILQDHQKLEVIMKNGEFMECQLTPKTTAKAA